jgi:hypothetical protein
VEDKNNEPSIPEIDKQPELTVDAPDYLEFGQNLYDQEPFSLVIADIQGQTGIQEGVFRNAVGRVITDQLEKARKLAEENRDYVEENADIPIQELIANYNLYRVIPINMRQRMEGIFKKGIGKLLEYPHIVDYVGERVNQGYYNKTGVFKSSYNKQLYSINPTKSYPKWLSDRLAREKRIMSLEVRSLVFEDTAGPRVKIEESGHKPGWKRWAIIKASELISK